ncbi:hypothetical protein [Rosenbergiella epipactidis]|uniref:hypothetical protein n=1 Tax=Rosenbergiella epipactidis TaxID=1544694 RepID=UPI001F4F7862|nr:hypothetical protein [Rosenbergiella epipactidis]
MEKTQISVIKTDAGKCFITDCKAKEGYYRNYHNSVIKSLVFDGSKATETFYEHWFEIPSFPKKIEKVISGDRSNLRFELKNPELESENLPMTIPYDDRDLVDDEAREALYNFKFDLVPDYLRNYDCDLVLLCEVDNFRDAPSFNYPAIKKFDFSDKKYTVTNKNVRHSLIDLIVTPEPLRANSPCEISSKEVYDLVRQHVKDNINPRLARITSDYDFCFTVKKIIPLLKPHTYSYQDIFARTKKQRAKLHFKTDTSKEIEIFQMTNEQDNYKGYTPINGFKAPNEWELKEMVDNFLSTLMETINSPIEVCPHCEGAGYLQNLSSQ